MVAVFRVHSLIKTRACGQRPEDEDVEAFVADLALAGRSPSGNLFCGIKAHTFAL
jgi:hypothetical protein